MACKQREPNSVLAPFFFFLWGLKNGIELQWIAINTSSETNLKKNQTPTTIKKTNITLPYHLHQQPEPAASNQGATKHPQRKVMAKQDVFFKSRMILGHKDEPKEKKKDSACTAVEWT